jgi:nitroimidazol reductase NimA-like FMN-containing flavoprotein (pyridoxamine 5'-phosphate oxidase superfamily)
MLIIASNNPKGGRFKMDEKKIYTNNPFEASEHVHPMTRAEIEQFLTVAPVGRLGMNTPKGPYVIPVGYCFSEGKIAIHMCRKQGRKMRALRDAPIVCFEVDESISDASLAKSVVITGRAEIISEPKRMIPYLQLHIDKYRIPMPYGQYASRNNRKEEALHKYGMPELEMVRICCITPHEITGRSIRRVWNQR